MYIDEYKKRLYSAYALLFGGLSLIAFGISEQIDSIRIIGELSAGIAIVIFYYLINFMAFLNWLDSLVEITALYLKAKIAKLRRLK